LVAVLGLIDTRPPPEVPRRTWDPHWLMWLWIALATASGYAGITLSGLPGLLAMCAALACGCRAATVAMRYGDGLREHRQ